MDVSPLMEITNELPFFKTVDDREKLLGVIGALVLRKIGLGKASEIMGMERERFLGLLDASISVRGTPRSIRSRSLRGSCSR